jgi:hypothetical protein
LAHLRRATTEHAHEADKAGHETQRREQQRDRAFASVKSSSAGPGSERRANSATSWQPGSSRPSSKVISLGSKRCSLTTWS